MNLPSYDANLNPTMRSLIETQASIIEINSADRYLSFGRCKAALKSVKFLQ